MDEEKNLPTSKIAVQKIIFYLQEKGVGSGYEFEPYAYGPFSRQVMETASDLASANELIIKKTDYVPEVHR